MTTTTQSPTQTLPISGSTFDVDRHCRRIAKLIKKKSFCTLASSSHAGYSQSAGVVYEVEDGALWIHCDTTSRKGRNVATNPKVGICVPFRRLPAGPPYTIHFQADAEIVAMDDPQVLRLLEAGKLKKIAGHGALDMPDGCFLRVTPTGTVHSYGPGIRALDLIRDPLNSGARSVRFDAGWVS